MPFWIQDEIDVYSNSKKRVTKLSKFRKKLSQILNDPTRSYLRDLDRRYKDLSDKVGHALPSAPKTKDPSSSSRPTTPRGGPRSKVGLLTQESGDSASDFKLAKETKGPQCLAYEVNFEPPACWAHDTKHADVEENSLPGRTRGGV